jgi:hypothetical protein
LRRRGAHGSTTSKTDPARLTAAVVDQAGRPMVRWNVPQPPMPWKAYETCRRAIGLPPAIDVRLIERRLEPAKT